MAIGPAVGRSLDLGPGDEFAGSIGQPQGLRDDEEVDGDEPQRSPGHLLLGTMRQVAETLLSQRAIPLARQRMRALEELLEHSRTSKGL